VFHRLLATIETRFGPYNWLRRDLRDKFGVRLRVFGEVMELRRNGRIIRIATRLWPFSHEVAANFDSYFQFVTPTDRTLDFSCPAVHRYLSGEEFLLTSLPEEQAAIDSYFVAARPVLGDLAFDIGANCGVTSYRLSRMVGATGTVIAFEPDPANYAALLDNIRRHKLSNVRAVPLALADHDGHIFFNAEGSLGSGIGAFVPRLSAGSIVQVECLTLDSAVQQFGVPAFIKMDIEGAEVAVLSSARDFLARRCCSFSIDTAHILDGDITAKPVEAVFAAARYETATIRRGTYVTTWARPTGSTR
jgi:FkbM family methyltransferase